MSKPADHNNVFDAVRALRVEAEFFIMLHRECHDALWLHALLDVVVKWPSLSWAECPLLLFEQSLQANHSGNSQYASGDPCEVKPWSKD